MQDHYQVLQVHPSADQDAIEAAYTRLKGLYDPTRLAGAADELVALAREKLQAVELAYSVLSNAEARARYDEQQRLMSAALAARPQATREVMDYRPLPPAKGQERDRRAALEPSYVSIGGRNVAGTARPAWMVPAIVSGILTLLVMVTSLVLTNGGGGAAAPAATPLPTQAAQQLLPLSDVVAQYDQLTAQAAEVARQQNTSDAWLQYGNALFDSVMVVREREPDGSLYKQRIPLWLQATDAYSKALALNPNDAVARSDLGVSYCYYGKDTGNAELVTRGVREARQAQQQDAAQPRVLLNLGICLVQQDPPAVQEALEYWRSLAAAQPASIEGQQAQALITRFQQAGQN